MVSEMKQTDSRTDGRAYRPPPSPTSIRLVLFVQKQNKTKESA
jgi:hypothetical protein